MPDPTQPKSSMSDMPPPISNPLIIQYNEVRSITVQFGDQLPPSYLMHFNSVTQYSNPILFKLLINTTTCSALCKSSTHIRRPIPQNIFPTQLHIHHNAISLVNISQVHIHIHIRLHSAPRIVLLHRPLLLKPLSLILLSNRHISISSRLCHGAIKRRSLTTTVLD